MTVDEAKKAFNEIKAQGGSEEDILGTLYLMFQEDKIDVNELEALVNVLGYELSDEFKAMSPEDQKTKGFEEVEETEASKEEVEEAKEADKPEEKQNPNEGEGGEEKADEGESDEGEKEDSEIDEEKEAKKLFGSKDSEDEESDEEKEAKKLFGFEK